MSNSNSKKKPSPKTQEELLDMTFQFLDDDVEIENSNKSNIKKYLKENIWVFTFVFLMIIAFIFTAIHEAKHPMTCVATGTIKEIISLNQNYAQLRLTNNQVINYQINNQKKVSNTYMDAMGNLQSTTTLVNEYKVGIKPQDKICLQYSRN